MVGKSKSEIRKWTGILVFSICLAISFTGALILSCWIFDHAFLAVFLHGKLLVSPNLAFCFMLIGLAISLQTLERDKLILPVIIMACITLLAGSLTLAENLAGLNLDIDNIFGVESLRALKPRMLMLSAINVTMTSILVLLLSVKWKRINIIIHVLYMLTFASALIGLVSISLDFTEVVQTDLFDGITVFTSSTFMFLTTGAELILLRRTNFIIPAGYKLMLGVVFTGILVLFIAYVSNNRIISMRNANSRVNHTITVKKSLNEVLTDVLDLQTNVRGYMLTSDTSYLRNWKSFDTLLPGKLDHLDSLVSDNSLQRLRCDRLRRLVYGRLRISDSLVLTEKMNGHKAAMDIFRSKAGQNITDSIKTLLSSMDRSENELMISRIDRELGEASKARSVTYVNMLLQLFLIIVIVVTVGRNIRRKQRILDLMTTSNEELEKRIADRTALLRKSEERFRSTMENMLEGCQIIDREWKYTYINGATEKQIRRARKELIGHRYQEMWPGVDRTELFLHLSLCMDQRIASSFRSRFEFPDGTVGWFDLSVQPVPEGIFILTVDVSEKMKAEETVRESERIYKYLFHNNPQPMWIYDLMTLEFIEVNEAAISHYGYSREEFLMMNIRDIRPADELEKSLEFIRSDREAISSSGPWKHLKKNGEVVFVEIKSHLIEFNGKSARLVLANDITIKKIAEDQLLRMNQSLEEMVKERTEQL